MRKRIAARVVAVLAVLCVSAFAVFFLVSPDLDEPETLSPPSASAPEVHEPEPEPNPEPEPDILVDTVQYLSPNDSAALWTSVPEGAVCSHCGSSLMLDTYRLSNRWLTRAFLICRRDPHFCDLEQERLLCQYILCTNEECKLLYDKQVFTEHRIFCDHDSLF